MACWAGRRTVYWTAACKHSANERSVTSYFSVALGGVPTWFLALSTALRAARWHLMPEWLTPLHGGGQRFEPAAVHQPFYVSVQVPWTGG